MLRFAVPTDGAAGRPLSALPVVPLPSDRFFLGVYDGETRAFDDAPLDVEQEFISWEAVDELSAFLMAARARRRVPLVTIEPWLTASDVIARVLHETAAGRNDGLIRANAHAIGEHTPQRVLVRFAHEMDLVDSYPWASADPQIYVDAYRRYVDLFRAEGATNVTWLWSPAGAGNAAAYYPGDDYVDLIGVTALAYQGQNIRTGSDGATSFDGCFGPIYARLERFDKPIVVAELGIAADGVGDQARWLRGAYESFEHYPLLRGVAYFHSRHAPNVRTDEEPDFRLLDAALPQALPALPFPMQWGTDRTAAVAWPVAGEGRPITRLAHHPAGRRRVAVAEDRLTPAPRRRPQWADRARRRKSAACHTFRRRHGRVT